MVREEPAPCRTMVQDALGNDALAVERLYINKAQRSTVRPRLRYLMLFSVNNVY